ATPKADPSEDAIVDAGCRACLVAGPARHCCVGRGRCIEPEPDPIEGELEAVITQNRIAAVGFRTPGEPLGSGTSARGSSRDAGKQRSRISSTRLDHLTSSR